MRAFYDKRRVKNPSPTFAKKGYIFFILLLLALAREARLRRICCLFRALQGPFGLYANLPTASFQQRQRRY
jgi:hypothetical protein